MKARALNEPDGPDALMRAASAGFLAHGATDAPKKYPASACFALQLQQARAWGVQPSDPGLASAFLEAWELGYVMPAGVTRRTAAQVLGLRAAAPL
eukprot:9468482-Alexandrium_andersonii.AAC.1